MGSGSDPIEIAPEVISLVAIDHAVNQMGLLVLATLCRDHDYANVSSFTGRIDETKGEGWKFLPPAGESAHRAFDRTERSAGGGSSCDQLVTTHTDHLVR